jgi:thiol-disulfide isomerase/thioredoxin
MTSALRPYLRPALLGVLGVLVAVLVALIGGTTTAAATAVPPSSPALAATAALAAGDDEVELVLFWGDGCPHCAAEKEWLEDVQDEYPGLIITPYEVWYDEANRQKFVEAGERLGFEPSGVPTTIIGDRVWVGFSDQTAEEIETTIEVLGAGGAATGATTAGESSSARIDVPLVGEVGLADKSLVVSTLIIGFVDGVNPCSLWVISVLLAIVVRTGSRGRVVAVGSTFLVVTAGMYAVYMAGIYSAMTVMAHLGVIQAVVAGVALLFGAVSVKDYFAFKKGLSFTIKDSAKPGIYKRMRAASGHQNIFAALGATVVLAIGVSLLETPCTAGFPVLWTGMLADAGVGGAEAAGLFGLYMTPFLLDELVVFALAILTMRATKMQEKHGQLLKLVAGTTMLALGVVMLVRPETMEDPLGALVVFVLAFVAAWLVHRLTTLVRLSRELRAAAEGKQAPPRTPDKVGR